MPTLPVSRDQCISLSDTEKKELDRIIEYINQQLLNNVKPDTTTLRIDWMGGSTPAASVRLQERLKALYSDPKLGWKKVNVSSLYIVFECT